MYYRGASAAIVVFDVTNNDSYAGAKSWVKELQKRGDPNVIIALAGNKADCVDTRTVKTEVKDKWVVEFVLCHLVLELD